MEPYDPTLHCTIGPLEPMPMNPRPRVWKWVTALACVASTALLMGARPQSPEATAVMHTKLLVGTRAPSLRSVAAPRSTVRRGAVVDERDVPLEPVWPQWPQGRTDKRPDLEAHAIAKPNVDAAKTPLKNFPGALVAVPGLFAGTSLTGFWDSPHALSTVLGILAGGLCLVCSVPQLLKTFKTQSAKDISPQFAALRVTGDLGMVIGLNLIDAQLSQVALAWYFLLTNLVMLLQWWCFEGQKNAKTPSLDLKQWPHVVAAVICVGSVAGFCLQNDQPSIGAFLGWGSSLLLSGARVPQILHILRSRRVADLSPSLFGLTICGNITQMASVVTYSSDHYYLAAQIPFLLGCGAPIVLDSIIVALIARYSATAPLVPMAVPLERVPGRRVPYV
mmetsp:Transcript_65407/g.108723  ORF Transcript_65407/g.108723 Transcript_65407/m.108723 type:complete len:391 (+) Transcript_65407:46-1218(+)